jgi:hypothetical protein
VEIETMTTLKTVVVTTAVTLTTVALLGVGVAFAQGGTPWNHMGGYGWQDGTPAPGYGSGIMGSGGMMGQYSGSMQAMHAWMTQTGGMHTYMWASLAEALNLTPDALQAQLADGQTLTEIAAAQALDQTQLADALKAAMQAGMAQAVAEGALTQEQADKMLAQMAGRYAWMIEHLATGQMGPGMMDDGVPGGGMMGGYGSGQCHNTPEPTSDTGG